jgi:hypothetical protein
LHLGAMASTSPPPLRMGEVVEEGDCRQHQAVVTTSGALTSNPALPRQERGVVSVRRQAAIVCALIGELDGLLPQAPHGGAIRAVLAGTYEGAVR